MRYKWKRTVMFGYVCGLGFLAPCWTSRELRVIFLEVFKHWKKSWIALLLYASSKVGMFLCNYFVHVPWYKSQGYFHIFEHICAWIASAFMIRNRKISIYRDLYTRVVYILSIARWIYYNMYPWRIYNIIVLGIWHVIPAGRLISKHNAYL